MITDEQFIAFLQKLEADQRTDNGLLLSEWENNFLGTFISCHRHFFLTESRRKAIDRMWRKLGPALNFPHPLDAVTTRPKMAEADPAGCEYLVKLDGVQQRCNEPAEFQEPGRLRYCKTHAEQVQDACKRSKIRLALVKFPLAIFIALTTVQACADGIYQTPLSYRLRALGEFETGNNDFARGKDGERGRYQEMESTWREFNPTNCWKDFVCLTNADFAWAAAAEVQAVRVTHFENQFHREPTDAEWYLLWHRPARVLHPKSVEAARARRFAKLCKEEKP